MTRPEDRQILIRDIAQARVEGARLAPACALAGIDARTLQRWKAGEGLTRGDRRPDANHSVPSHALSEAERAQIVAVANEPRFADTPPARIVPALADEGIYIASDSSFHRVLRAHGQMNPRGRAQPPRTSRPPTTHIATRPGDVWCWDVTFLPAQIQGRWFYFYLILDLYSRKIVGFEVHDTDSAEHAAHLARRTAFAEGVHAKPVRPVLHGDNGATLKATTVLAMLHWLGIEPSYSRPRVSDDNSFAEALFRTAKYRPEFPSRDSPIWMPPGNGQRASCIGKIKSIRRSRCSLALDMSAGEYAATPACEHASTSKRMSGRLSGLKDAIKAERKPPQKVSVAPEGFERQGTSTRAKARIGKRALVGYFSPELSRTLNMMATERDTTLQAVLGEAIDLWLRENGKHPFGER